MRYLGIILFAALLAIFTPLGHAQVPAYASGSITTQNLVPAGVCTVGGCVELATVNASAITIQVSGTYTGALSVQVTNDGTNWVTLAAATAITNLAPATAAATIASATPGVYSVNTSGVMKARVTALAAVTGTAVVTMRTTFGSKV